MARREYGNSWMRREAATNTIQRGRKDRIARTIRYRVRTV
jgi:hypothetical protein